MQLVAGVCTNVVLSKKNTWLSVVLQVTGSRLLLAYYYCSLFNTLPKTKKGTYTAVTEAHEECT